MLISIITPTFNSEKTIEKNIRSVITQSYENYEHIIIDNLSKDNTIEIINKVYTESEFKNKLKIISEKDNGIADAFNKGIKNAKGNIVAILNSDDEYYHDKVFEAAAEAFEDENIIITYGNVYFNDKLHGTNIRFPFEDDVTGGIQFYHPAMFFRHTVYDKVGLYDTDYKYSMDYEYYCRLAKNISDLKKKVFYIKDKPMVKMNAGGVSWHNELGSIEEIKKALIQNGYWNKEGKKFYSARKQRTVIKKYLTRLHLNSFVKLWRRIKYGN